MTTLLMADDDRSNRELLSEMLEGAGFSVISVEHAERALQALHGQPAKRKRILQAGCNACISKPVDFKLLQDQLRLWLAAAPASQRGSRPRRATSVRVTESPNGTRGDDRAQ